MGFCVFIFAEGLSPNGHFAGIFDAHVDSALENKNQQKHIQWRKEIDKLKNLRNLLCFDWSNLKKKKKLFEN